MVTRNGDFAGVTIPVEFSHGLPRHLKIIRGHPSSYRTFILVGMRNPDRRKIFILRMA
eukprot:COSAG01_NODE_43381_length_430_cov_1.042296_1_plen_57_part_01